MSDFEYAYQRLMELEGGFSDDPDDAGGASKYGVSLRYLESLGPEYGDFDGDGDVDAVDVRKMSQEDAKAIYKALWWDRQGYGDIEEDIIAAKVFDLAVNMGARQAHLILQRALRACGRRVAEDGVIGPKTIGAANGADELELRAALRSEAAGVYRLIVKAHPTNSKFLQGWLNRAYS